MAVVASVLIAAHNAAGHLDRAIASALAQTCRAVEVIAVDDGSTDGTHGALVAWARRDRRVVVLRHGRNLGAAAARNTAIARATGHWLAVLDADDAFLPERVERMVAAAEERGADLLADNLTWYDADTGVELGGCLPEAAMAADGPVTLAEMLQRDMPDQPGRGKFGHLKPIVRRDFLARAGVGYDPAVRVGEDLLFYFECVARGAHFHLTPGAWYQYWRRTASTSAGRGGPLHLSAANRRMRAIARARGDGELAALLLRRQRLIDSDCFDLSVEMRRPLDALYYARRADPARVARRLRTGTDAIGRRIAARLASLVGRAAP
jgi:hypothetical protein